MIRYLKVERPPKPELPHSRQHLGAPGLERTRLVTKALEKLITREKGKKATPSYETLRKIAGGLTTSMTTDDLQRIVHAAEEPGNLETLTSLGYEGVLVKAGFAVEVAEAEPPPDKREVVDEEATQHEPQESQAVDLVAEEKRKAAKAAHLAEIEKRKAERAEDDAASTAMHQDKKKQDVFSDYIRACLLYLDPSHFKGPKGAWNEAQRHHTLGEVYRKIRPATLQQLIRDFESGGALSA